MGKSGSSHPSAFFPSMNSSAKGEGAREEMFTIWGEKEKVGNNYLGKWEGEFTRELWQNYLMLLGVHLKSVAINLK